MLRGIVDDGIMTDSGTFLLSDYSTTAFEATLVPAPGVAVGMLVGLLGRLRFSRRRRSPCISIGNERASLTGR
ncbi:MAG: hypothetical protein GY894_07580 [Planctomycetes bacterium]|nr:hypothetical protein [Planctomycetota bacterium]MCP4839206.1 hypothetical protein [Planctomycetota bacterium]